MRLAPRPNSRGTGSPRPFLPPGNKDKIPSVLWVRREPRPGLADATRRPRPGLATKRHTPCNLPPPWSSSGSAGATRGSGRATCRKEGHQGHPLCTGCALNESLTLLPEAMEFQIRATGWERYSC